MMFFNIIPSNFITPRKYTLPRSKFCLFSVTNGAAQDRVKFFTELTNYKKVDSCGKFMNNLGYNCPGTYESKEYHDFISQYKFMICFENSSVKNYLTEKLINAYKCGTIPIYWGCTNLEEYVNMDAILYLKPGYSDDDMRALIKEIEALDTDDTLYKKKYESVFFKNGVVPDLFDIEKVNLEICKRANVQRGGNKEGILIILVNHTMDTEYVDSMKELSKYIAHLSIKYTVDLAGISSEDNFSNYDGIIDFKYKYISPKGQLSKLCDFITEHKAHLKYDWFIKMRPGVQVLDYNTINFDALPKNAVSARARCYRGPHKNKKSCSVGGEGPFKIFLYNCINNEGPHKNKPHSSPGFPAKDTLLDDTVYIFHRNVIDKGGFAPTEGTDKENEFYHTNIWKSRNIELNVIGLDIKFRSNKYPDTIYSGNII
jgi:hypothetical protein